MWKKNYQRVAFVYVWWVELISKIIFILSIFLRLLLDLLVWNEIWYWRVYLLECHIVWYIIVFMYKLPFRTRWKYRCYCNQVIERLSYLELISLFIRKSHWLRFTFFLLQRIQFLQGLMNIWDVRYMRWETQAAYLSKIWYLK